MTRDLLLPLLAIVILANAGVIAYVIGHHRGREREPAWQPAEGPLAARPTTVAAPAAGPRDDPLANVVRPGESGAPAAVLAVDLIGPVRARPAAPPP